MSAGILAVALLGACGQPESASPDSSASASAAASLPSPGALTAVEKQWLADKGTLQIGAFNDYPPFGFVNDAGQAAGMSVDYWNLVAERLGVQVVFTPQLFADQINGLKKGSFDSLAGIFPLPERAQWFAFSQPYLTIDTRIFTADGAPDVDSLKALKDAARMNVAVVDGDSGQAIADEAGLTTLVVAGYPQAVKAVAEGAAQATILDQMVADYYITEFGIATKVKAIGKPVATGLMTMPVRKDDAVLLAILNKGIAMVGDSEFESIYEKWMGH